MDILYSLRDRNGIERKVGTPTALLNAPNDVYFPTSAIAAVFADYDDTSVMDPLGNHARMLEEITSIPVHALTGKYALVPVNKPGDSRRMDILLNVAGIRTWLEYREMMRNGEAQRHEPRLPMVADPATPCLQIKKPRNRPEENRETIMQLLQAGQIEQIYPGDTIELQGGAWYSLTLLKEALETKTRTYISNGYMATRFNASKGQRPDACKVIDGVAVVRGDHARYFVKRDHQKHLSVVGMAKPTPHQVVKGNALSLEERLRRKIAHLDNDLPKGMIEHIEFSQDEIVVQAESLYALREFNTIYAHLTQQHTQNYEHYAKQEAMNGTEENFVQVNGISLIRGKAVPKIIRKHHRGTLVKVVGAMPPGQEIEAASANVM